MPKKMPTEAENPRPMANDHQGSEMGKPETRWTAQPTALPRMTPIRPPSDVRNAAPIRTCKRISARRGAGVRRQLLFDTQLHYAACAFVLAGNGVSIVDPITAQHYAKLGLVVKRFEPRIDYRYAIIFPRHRSKSGLTKAFVELLKGELADLQRASGGLFEMGG